MTEADERARRATHELQHAWDRMATAFEQTDPAVERTAEQIDAILEACRDSVDAMRVACDHWARADAAACEDRIGFPSGSLVVAATRGGNVLTRTTAPTFVHEGDEVVALEGLEGLWSVALLLELDEVRAYVGEVMQTGEPVGVQELGEEGCPGCEKLATGLVVLQEFVRRNVARPQTKTEEDPDAN